MYMPEYTVLKRSSLIDSSTLSKTLAFAAIIVEPENPITNRRKQCVAGGHDGELFHRT